MYPPSANKCAFVLVLSKCSVLPVYSSSIFLANTLTAHPLSQIPITSQLLSSHIFNLPGDSHHRPLSPFLSQTDSLWATTLFHSRTTLFIPSRVQKSKYAFCVYTFAGAVLGCLEDVFWPGHDRKAHKGKEQTIILLIMLIDPYGEIFSFHWEVRVRLKVRIMELVRIHISGHRHHSKSKYYWKINTGCIKPHETLTLIMQHFVLCWRKTLWLI